MKNWMHRILALIFLSVTLVSPQNAFAQDDMVTQAKQAIIIDYNTNSVLFEKNADAKMPTSSMSKVMTMYLVFEALQKGHLSLDDTLLVSEKAWRKGGSKMFVPVGKNIKVEDLVRGVVVQSGNDATIVLAEGLAGSENAFVLALNKKAKELGMHNSNFTNASGWPDPDHYSTARDLAILATAMIKNFPEYYHYYAEKEFTYHKIKQENRNPLLYRNIGADGLKTGHTDDGGYGLIGTGIKNNRRVIMVLNGMASSKERTNESTRLLQWGLNGFRNVTLFAKDKDLGRVSVLLGAKSFVGLRASYSKDLTIPNLLASDLKVEITYKSPIKAPVEKNAKLGTITIYVPDGEILELPLLAFEDVPEMNFFAKLISKARILTSGQGTLSP